MATLFERAKSVLTKKTEEEALTLEILDNKSDILIQLNDQRLNKMASYTYNIGTCDKIFALLEPRLTPAENDWKAIYNALILLYTFTVFGSEIAVDKAINLARFVNRLVDYNSALNPKTGYLFTGSGGVDRGAPVRDIAAKLNPILLTDEGIRNARQNARSNAAARSGEELLVPIGEVFTAPMSNVSTNSAAGATFGQGLNSSVGNELIDNMTSLLCPSAEKMI